MDLSIYLDAITCIKCGRCVKVCPARIFRQEKPGREVITENRERCIFCGQCVAVCPSGSILHSDFPPEKVHVLNHEQLPFPEQVLLLCRARRSARAFTAEPIPQEKLDMILEAAYRAPTASNLQKTTFTLVTDPVKIKKVAKLTLKGLYSNVRKLNNPFLKPLLKIAMPGAYKYVPKFKSMKEEYENGKDPILYDATALLLIHTPQDTRFGCQDANLAYQNASLMAESLGIGQFYTGFVCTAIAHDKKNRIKKLLGIEGTVHAGMALGIPQFKYTNYVDKKDIAVNRVEKMKNEK